MAVATGVVADAFMTTFLVGTGVDMAAHGGRAALAEYPQSLLNIAVGLFFLVKALVKFSDNLGQAMLGFQRP